jgi:hypothetical protein
MSRRIVVLVFSLVVFIGTTAMLAPPASSADTSWTTLSRHCWRIEYRGDRLRTCVSIRGRLVDERVMIRTRCRVKMLTFETETIWLQNCMLVKEFDYEVVASVPETQRSGVTGAIVKTPARRVRSHRRSLHRLFRL